MESEKRLAEFVSETKFEDLPRKSIETIKNVILTILGTTIAGATAEGCEPLMGQVKEWGGKKEATILIHGGKVPAYNAALVNSTMARALDFCDAMMPGMHVGSSSVPTALAAAELAGGCTGKEFLSALVLGTEVSARINSVSLYDGFDPTGICSIFATAAITGRILHLDSKQMWNVLALAFNKAGGSFQSNIDGSLAVRVIQGFVSQGGIICAQLAQRGITGPKNFLEGTYGYFHLFAKDKHNPQAITQGLGTRFEMDKTLFKKYPSCGGTLGSTDAILALVKEKGITPKDVEHIDVEVPPYNCNLVGGDFKIGDNPKVNAQFNIQYCVANALLRKSSRLNHFDESFIRDPEVIKLTKKVRVIPVPALDDPERLGFSLAAHLKVTTKNGDLYSKAVDIPRGIPGNPMTHEEHMERFQDCISYARKPLSPAKVEKIISMVGRLDEVGDVRTLIPLLLAKQKRS
ncbi:MAG TPA: MmgE/PrpD family protein [Thermodesulfobacteriota bacterium]|nr:MmgE/PrpD family protein [Thermodesulfobacteriota bacterium]